MVPVILAYSIALTAGTVVLNESGYALPCGHRDTKEKFCPRTTATCFHGFAWVKSQSHIQSPRLSLTATAISCSEQR
jgi:hypothetical protein